MNEVTPIDEEFPVGEGTIISQTDEKGIITYANRAFCEVSGYSANELHNQPHSIIRHPDMPKTLFEKLWSTIKSGQAWNGLMKNLRKDGRYYWVDTEILPIKDENEQITGYIAARRAASRKDIEENKETYRKMLASEQQ
jgi:aerotaxis receptor